MFSGKSFKKTLKVWQPRFLHHLYNKIVSRRLIKKRVGKWFDIDWKKKASTIRPTAWVAAYDNSWENWTQPDLSLDDLVRISKLIPDHSTVLDIGCGDGYLLDSIKERSDDISGVDISSKALRMARERLSEVTPLIQAFMENLPFRTDSYRVSISTHTLEHVQDLKKAVQEIIRITSHRLIILVPEQEYLPFTEDYHINFFPNEDALLRTVNLPGAKCVSYKCEGDEQKYSGNNLLLYADLNKDAF